MARLHTHDQHFLRSPRLVAELIGHSNIRKNDTVYDLGAGSGVITSVLARRAKQVVAIENEPHTLSKLRRNLATFTNVKIVEGDLLEITPQEESYKIFSNIPFSLSAQVIKKFTQLNHPPKSIYLVTQKQFAKKLVPGSDHFTSALSAQIGPWWQVRIRRPLKKTDFTPPPAVDTVLLELKPRLEAMLPTDARSRYQAFIETCFDRQTFFGALPRHEAAITPELRPSQLTLEQWIALYNVYSKNFKA